MPSASLGASLGRRYRLEGDDANALAYMCWNTRTVDDRRDIVCEGHVPDRLYLIVEGWAARYKLLPDGSRQIVGFLLPCDFSDPSGTMTNVIDYGIVALTRVRVAYLSPGALATLQRDRPALAHALHRSALIDNAMLRAWVTNLGRRSSHGRTAHLLCELSRRMAAIGIAPADRMALPITQEILSDALGITSVYLNRVLGDLKDLAVVSIGRSAIVIEDMAYLERLAAYNDAYLHGERGGACQSRVSGRTPDQPLIQDA